MSKAIDRDRAAYTAVIRRGTLPFRTLLAVALQRSPADEEYCRVVLELLSTAGSLRAALQTSRADLKLNELEIGVLVSLFALEPDPGTPVTLAEQIRCRRTVIAAVLGRLQARAFVRREQGGRDRRTTFVHVTAHGRAATEAVLVRFIDHASRLVREVPADAAQAGISVCHQPSQIAPRRAPTGSDRFRAAKSGGITAARKAPCK